MIIFRNLNLFLCLIYASFILAADDNLDIKPVRWIDEVFKIVLTEVPKPWIEDKTKDSKTSKKSKNTKNKLETH